MVASLVHELELHHERVRDIDPVGKDEITQPQHRQDNAELKSTQRKRILSVLSSRRGIELNGLGKYCVELFKKKGRLILKKKTYLRKQQWKNHDHANIERPFF